MGRKRKTDNLRKNLWLITFSDLATLLMALFVLLFSMSSLDSNVVERISSQLQNADTGRDGVKTSVLSRILGQTQTDSSLKTALELLADNRNLRANQEAIKELIFPTDVLPPEVDKGMLKDKVMLVSREDGVSIVLSEDILFEPGQAVLPGKSRKFLQALSPLLRQAGHDIMITGHSDEVFFDAANQDDLERVRYQLSELRALAVLELYLNDKLDPRYFSTAGYGADRPLPPTDAAQAGPGSLVGNRRVEIIIKNADDGWY
ncbi:MAG: OmpA family protein [Deltaproteobacteria bacterium]|jgi:chemotaxis protein MotB|nr:OmpA family protein [Deltaproteobacteria bacterium]